MTYLKQKYAFDINKDQYGEGSFGKVYKAQDLKSNETVAIKVLNVDNVDDNNIITKEIKILKNLKHENVIAYIDNFKIGKKMYLVTEFC